MAHISRFTREMSFEEALEAHTGAAHVFGQYGIGCSNCVVAPYETIAEGARSHHIDVEALLADLNALLTSPQG
ncbi:MAG: DUF1858 domain-containing protein [Nitrospirota bacterium]|nr:DUF1858 domain-containing protein [Nitrospirota bacterium]